MTTVTTSQAPTAKPVGVSLELTTAYQTIIAVPDYLIPVAGSTDPTETRTAPGVAEVSSPLLLTNKDSVSRTVSVRITRAGGSSFILANALVVEPYDVVIFPLNGQFLQTDDVLQVLASANSAVDATISYTVGQAEEDDVI
jgi:hypothetical protein